jgi:adenine phosphoribosyltransferase
MEATPAELELQTLVCLVAELTQHLGVEPEVRGFPPEDLLYTWILSNFVFWVKKKGSLYTLTGHARPNTGAFTLHAGSVEAAARVASNVLRRFNRSPEKGLLSMGSDSIRAARVEAAPPYVLATLNETSFQLPLIEAPAVGGCVALFNLRGDWALTEHVGCALARRLSAATEAVDVWVMPAGKAEALLHVVGRESKRPTVVFPKEHKAHMGAALEEPLPSTPTTGIVQRLFLTARDRPALEGLRWGFVDDVISTGGSLRVVERLAQRVNATITVRAAIFTEGEPRADVVALGHLPVFK